MIEKEHPELEKSELIKDMPRVCGDETAAVEFFEQQRWNGAPVCVHCSDANVYQMKDRDGSRNKRFLWRCRKCGEQFTVRTGTVYEDSRLPLRHWAFAFWRACSSKKGCPAREIQRQCSVSYKTALFLMHRVRFALSEDTTNEPKQGGDKTVEADETYVGGKPRPTAFGATPAPKATTGYKLGSKKVPVVAMVERGGKVRTKVVPKVTQKNLYRFLDENIQRGSVVNTDQYGMYRTILWPIISPEGGRHDVVNHSKKEYIRKNPDGTVSGVNHAESFFSLLKRGIMGSFHAVSPEHLHRYCDEFAFRWNTRKLNDGERLAAAIKSSIGKRLEYVDYVR
jgi:transposase-like protein